MAGIENLQKLVNIFKKKAAAIKGNKASVIVGYTANYALYVHESIEMKLKGQKRRGLGHGGNYWDPPSSQAKFLEQPFREMKKELTDFVMQALKRGTTMAQALLLAGLRLQRESQKLVPVDTGNLKASAFTRLDKNG